MGARTHLQTCPNAAESEQAPSARERGAEDGRGWLVLLVFVAVLYSGLCLVCACDAGSQFIFSSNSCAPCAAGEYRAPDTLSMCRPCDEGLVSDPGSAQCSQPGAKPCPQGQSDSGLAQGCVDCPPGFFKRADGSGVCAPCPINTFAAEPGSAKCSGCLRGEASAQGQTSCQLCPAGTFAAKSGACELCGAGSSSEEGSETCTCEKGWTRGRGQGSHACSMCPANTFKAVRGSGACTACPFGLVSPKGSDDFEKCATEDMLGSLSVHLVSLVKGAGSAVGLVEENPSERRWRKQAFEAASKQLAEASDRIYQATKFILSQLHSLVLELFASAAHFERCRAKQGQEEARASAHVCSSQGALREWLHKRDEYSKWRSAMRGVKSVTSSWGGNRGPACGKMKKAARNLLLILHPDKFAQMHPGCPQDMSTPLAAELNSQYDDLKALCAGL